MKNIYYQNIKNDTLARNGSLTINLPLKTKTILTPALLAQPGSSIEIDYICEWIRLHNPVHFGGLVVPLLSYKKIMLNKETLLHSKTIDDFIDNDKIYSNIRKNMLLIIDPESENTYYKSKFNVNEWKDLPNEYLKFSDTPPKRNLKLDLYKKFIEELSNKSHTYTLKFLKKEKEAKSDILLSPSPLIVPEIPDSYDVAIKINKDALKICKMQNGWISSSYFVLKTSCFDDDEKINLILDYVKNNKPEILFFKIIDSYSFDNRNSTIQRMYFHIFLKKLSKITFKLKIPVFWLNLDTLGIFLTLIGADGFSTPVNGYIQKMCIVSKNIQIPQHLKGKFFHYPTLSMIPFKFIYDMHKKGNHIPCPYGCCEKYNQMKLELLSRTEKSKMTRIHYLNTFNGILTEIDFSISNKTTRTVINTLANSSCKHFYEILEGVKIKPILSVKKY